MGGEVGQIQHLLENVTGIGIAVASPRKKA